MLGVGREAIRDVDHRGGAVIGQPAARFDARLRAHIAVAQRGRHARAGAKLFEGQGCASEIPGDPESVAVAGAGAAHRPIRDADHAHVHHVAIETCEITTQHFRLDILRHARDTGHDLRGRVRTFLAVRRRNP